MNSVTDGDDLRGLRAVVELQKSMGVNYMPEVKLVRLNVSRQRERSYLFHRRYCCGRGRRPLGDQKKTCLPYGL